MSLTVESPIADRGAPRSRSAFGAQSLIFAGLALVTILPLAWLGFGVGSGFMGFSTDQKLALWPAIAIAGVGHVAATSFYYTDRGFAPLVRTNRSRFYLWPLLCVAVSYGAFALGPPVSNVVISGFLAWQLWHFQRQNYGIIAFAARSANFGVMPGDISRMLNITAIGGAAALLAGEWILLFAFAAGLFALAIALFIRLLVSEPRLRRNPRVLGFTVLGWAFFLPTLFPANPISSYWSFAIGHGAQYLILIAALSGRALLGWVGAILFASVGLAAWFLAPLLDEGGGASAVIMGLTMSHFLIDAKTWRMRDKLQRDLLQKRLSFLFS